MSITKEDILQALRQVHDPELHRDIVSLDRVKNVAYCDGHATIRLSLPPGGESASGETLRQRVTDAVQALGEQIQQVRVELDLPQAGSSQSQTRQQQQQGGSGASEDPQQAARENNPLPDVKHIIAIGAGKGGVGKSTVAVTLALALARAGSRVGLLDGDIYGPSTPTMLGLHEIPPRVHNNMIIPFDVHGIKAVTIGKLVEEEKPLIWRGPMAHGAFRQLATQTEWGELDYLIIDLPPGTGDVPLTMSQLLPLTGAVVVCTPQKVAQDDARRAVGMFQQLGIPVLGIIENMSYFIGDDGKEYDIFGRGGAKTMAEAVGVNFLGTVPINMAMREHLDAGNPTAIFDAADTLAEELDTVARKLSGQISVLRMSGALEQPTIEIH